MGQQKKYTTAFIIITSLFFLWGFITVFVDSLIPRLKEVFELNFFQAGLVQFAFFMAYGLLSIPAGFMLSKIGYKKGVVVGLLTMGLGCFLFFPAASMRVFPLFMLAYFVLAGGMTFLQVAANPYVSVLGPEESASSRLNLSQAFNSLGTAIAPAFGAILILSDNVKSSDEIKELDAVAKEAYFASEASAVQTPFIVLAGIIILLAVFFAIIKLPEILSNNDANENDTDNSFSKEVNILDDEMIHHRQNNNGFLDSYIEAFRFPQLKWGALGIFVYVGAEVAIGSYLVNYFLDMNLAEAIKNNDFMSSISSTVLGKDLAEVDNKGIVGAFVLFYWTGAMVGRFIGAYLTKKFNPSNILSIFGLGAITMILISIMTTGFISMWSIIFVGLFNSIMFPTIFTLAINGIGKYKPQGSGILCTAIVGGAFIPPLYGLLTDSIGFKMALVLVIICYTYITLYGRIRNNIAE